MTHDDRSSTDDKAPVDASASAPQDNSDLLQEARRARLQRRRRVLTLLFVLMLWAVFIAVQIASHPVPTEAIAC